jgi:aminoglycoside 6'-N-acetyltransferase I
VSDAGFLIRPVQSDDHSAWLGLRRQLWPDGTEEQHAADISRFFDAPHRSVGTMPEQAFIAVTTGKGSEVLGFAEVSRRLYAEGCETSPVGFLEGWYVVADRRRQGIGRALVAAGEAWARALGCREFASDAVAENHVSASAHRALGFDEVEVIRCFRKDLIP